MATPKTLSVHPEDVDISVAELGAQMLGLPLFEQGRNVARVLCAKDPNQETLYGEVVVQMPRRSTKTTSIWATLIGRAASNPGYVCVTTAQKGTVASRIITEHANKMIRAGTAIESREKGTHPGKVQFYRSAGRERLDFPNGSQILAVPPNADTIRSAGSDDILIDEAGELDPEAGQDFLMAVLPLMDTKGPNAQLILAGTPGKQRSGFFWEWLESARNGEYDYRGVVDYSMGDGDDPTDEAVWLRVHPGPSCGLTPLKVLRRRFTEMPLEQFSREYLCLWPLGSNTRALDLGLWQAGAGGIEDIPEDAAVAFDIEKDDSSAAICAAWRDDQGAAHISILEHRYGTSWLALELKKRAVGRNLKVAYDGIGSNHGTATDLSTGKVKVQLHKYTAKDQVAATQRLVSDLEGGLLKHPNQAALNNAAERATWRFTESGRMFRRTPAVAAPLVAAALALWMYDTKPVRKSVGIVTR